MRTKIHQWTDKCGDMGEVWASGDVVCVAMTNDHSIASHDMLPDTARAVADALIQAAFEIDGKRAGVSDLVAQLEQARAEIERLKGTPDAHGIKPCPFCGEKGILSSSRLRWWVVTCESCGAECDDTPSRQEAIDMWNRRGGE